MRTKVGLLGIFLAAVGLAACGGKSEQDDAGASVGTTGTSADGTTGSGTTGSGTTGSSTTSSGATGSASGSGGSSSGQSATGSGGSATGGGRNSGGSGGLEEPEKHRPTAVECDDERPAPEVPPLEGGECQSHEECTDGRNGRCTSGRIVQCTYDECFTDSDCGTGRTCACEGSPTSDANACLASNCSSDEDCGPGGFCGPSFGTCGSYSGVIGYYCRTAEDECLNDGDCVTPDPSTGAGPGYCAFAPELDHWVCMYSHCVG